MRAGREMSSSVRATSMILLTCYFFPDRACAHNEVKAVVYLGYN